MKWLIVILAIGLVIQYFPYVVIFAVLVALIYFWIKFQPIKRLKKVFRKEPSLVEKSKFELNRINYLANKVNTTYDFEEFTKSFIEIVNKLESLKSIEYHKFFSGAKPSEDLAVIRRNRSLTEKEFVDRFVREYGKESLRGKEEYFDKFSPEAADYINSILKEFEKSPEEVVRIDFDNMEGHEFERFCADVLLKNGFESAEVTQGSGDHGIDILAEKDGITYAIQCKCYSSNIGNAAVQQAHTGKSIYRKDIAVVLTNRYFTAQAKEEAAALGVKLWDRDKLNSMIEKNRG